MSTRSPKRNKDLKRKLLKNRRDRITPKGSDKSNFFRLKNISEKRNFRKINIDKFIDESKAVASRRINNFSQSLKLKEKLLNLSEVKNDPLLSKEIQEKIDYFITPYNKLVNLKKHLEYEEDFHEKYSPVVKKLTKKDDEKYSKFISDKLWSKITHLILKNKENFDFQINLITKILSYKGMINEDDLSRLGSNREMSKSNLSVRKSPGRKVFSKKKSISKKIKINIRKFKKASRMILKRQREKRNSVLVNDKRRIRPQSINISISTSVNDHQFREDSKCRQSQLFSTILTNKSMKTRDHSAKRAIFKNFYYRRSMDDPMPKLSFNKNDDSVIRSSTNCSIRNNSHTTKRNQQDIHTRLVQDLNRQISNSKSPLLLK
ncbi:unnamed protein product [Moneuplotes crassus]|uniref:Uncharacterized protein n=1 Tax=Euplotes crassus TaxID=5936 RepID=A0AAD1UIG8_EUPCR|nr:unnamed protein product [Moneuplotes crassus]